MADETKIQWHNAFRSAMELTFLDNADSLDYDDEYLLSRKSLQIDLLVINKDEKIQIKDEIGHIFQHYNVLEYKSPGDSLNIDTYYKVLAYGCLLKVQKNEKANETKRGDITLTMVRREKPEQMFKDLIGEGITISCDYPGIYHLSGGVTFETQVIVTKELPPGSYVWLKALTRNLDKTEAAQFVNDMIAFPEGSKERALADSVLQVTMSANYAIFEELKKEDPIMCNALKELMRPEMEEAVDNRNKEIAENMIKDGTLSDDKIAQFSGLTIKQVQDLKSQMLAMA